LAVGAGSVRFAFTTRTIHLQVIADKIKIKLTFEKLIALFNSSACMVSYSWHAPLHFLKYISGLWYY